jgi:hypothetical protein
LATDPEARLRFPALPEKKVVGLERGPLSLDNIRMDLGEMGWGDVDWIGLAQDRNRWRALVNSVLNFRVP